MKVSMNPKAIKIVLVGALGGTAPTLLRVAIDLVNGSSSIGQLNASILLGIGLFGLLGGIMAAIWGESDLKKVFYLGLGLPSFLTVAASHGTAPAPGAPAMAYLRPVYAAGNSVPGRKLTIQTPPELSAVQPQAVFGTDTGDQAVPIRNNELVVPSAATSVRIQSSLGASNSVTLPGTPNAVIKMKVAAAKDVWFGLKYAVGVHSTPYSLVLSIVSTS